MPEKFKNKYRDETTRAPFWNYGSNAAYFITACTKNRQHYFGEIENVQSGTKSLAYLRESEIGKIAKEEWLKTPFLRPQMNLALDEFIVMPNHFHAIIWIGENEYNTNQNRHREVASHDAPPMTTETMDEIHNSMVKRSGPQSNNLSSIMRGFKSAVTTYSRKKNIEFDWQSRFHDHIIRNERELYVIRNYIKSNLQHWKTDKLH